MKIIELRRHSIRDSPFPHLNQRGVEKARRVGDTFGDFKHVISSNAPRSLETAVAMGYAVDKVMEEISMTPEEIEKEVTWGMDFDQYSEVVKQGSKTAEYASQMALFIKDIANMLAENESALLVSHGRVYQFYEPTLQ
ncbi:MAG: histidine phosphatase family protein [Candidatus Heimdallarchaeaceae archaeon]